MDIQAVFWGISMLGPLPRGAGIQPADGYSVPALSTLKAAAYTWLVDCKGIPVILHP